jgi:hypothetical protein
VESRFSIDAMNLSNMSPDEDHHSEPSSETTNSNVAEVLDKKLKNQAKNEAKRHEKMKKFMEKQEKLQQLRETQAKKKEAPGKTSKVDKFNGAIKGLPHTLHPMRIIIS